MSVYNEMKNSYVRRFYQTSIDIRKIIHRDISFIDFLVVNEDLMHNLDSS